MDYNLFKQKVDHLHQELEDLKSKKQILADELNWFDSDNETNLFIALESNNELRTQINILDQEISQLLLEIEETKQLMEIDISQRWILHDKNVKLAVKQELKRELQKSLQNIEIEKYKNFNRQKIIEDIDNIDQQMALLEEEYCLASELSNKAESELQPVIDMINYYEAIIFTNKSKINDAISFENKLSAANGAYERAIIHAKCEEILGDGNPRRIKRQIENEIRPIERDLNKTKKRAASIAKKILHPVKKIIIDGNNMCYEDDKFVGLSLLIKLTNELKNKYSIIIIFDSTIRGLLRTSDQDVKKLFDNDITIHIVATKQSADETILDIASNDSFCYILSNDRFSEYQEKEVVNNNRLIRHEIVDSKLIIHDLDLNIKYTRKYL